MAANKGNRFWEARSSHGRKPIFATPDDLWSAACEYFEWVEDNPLWATSTVNYQGSPVDLPEAKMRAMTFEGLRIFLGISTQTWYDYHDREGYIEVTERISDVIRTQKFEGASAGLFNANIIARDLGLKDASTSEHTGAGGGPIRTEHALFEFNPVGADD